MNDDVQTGHCDSPSDTETRSGFAAIVGRPNVGKSTLLNAVLGAKLAIVSHRPQTTRNRVVGVRTSGSQQVVFVDTPGIHRSRVNLNRFMVQEALSAVDGVDCVIFVTEVDPKQLARLAKQQDPGELRLHPDDEYVLEQVQLQQRVGQKQGLQPIIAINKIDLVQDRALLLPLMAAWNAAGFELIVPISALKANGIERLLREIYPLLPVGPHLYPEDMLTDRAERFLAAELIREQVFVRCHQELPYATAVEIEAFSERANRGDVVISAVIHVEREGQKAIVIGKKGTMIKTIGTAAREEISRLVGCPVHLQLSVHVESDWTHSPGARRRFGYE